MFLQVSKTYEFSKKPKPANFKPPLVPTVSPFFCLSRQGILVQKKSESFEAKKHRHLYHIILDEEVPLSLGLCGNTLNPQPCT